MDQVLKEIYQIGIVPVIALENAADAKPLAQALIDGGLPCAEVTFRTDAAYDSIRIMTENFPTMLVGAGTVLTTAQVDRAVEAGAKFIVSPGLNPEVVRYCIEKKITVCPGTSNPSDIEQAIALGLDTVKFFPAEACGGLAMIKAMAAPYTGIRFMPTGGINAKNMNDYLAFDRILACGGSWMVKSDLIKSGEFDTIRALTKEAVENMLGFGIKHVGVNAKDAGEAERIADTLQGLFGFSKKMGNSSVFAGEGFEIMKEPYLGTNGHVAIGVNNVDRAFYHLKMRGCSFNMDTAKYDDAGRLKVVYLADEIGGFALHLVKW